MPDHKPPSAPRIAISFGKNSSSSSSSKPNRPPPPPPSRLGKRSSRKKPRDLVITKQSNRDWKAELRAKRGGKNLLPAEAQAAQAGAGRETEPADAQKDMQWGLTTADEAALDALLGKKRASEERTIRPSEDSAYKDDVAQHVGADATMEDYDAIPDGEFGAALLRGMGWDGKMRGPKPSRAAAGERRQNQLGLGAKKLQDAEDLGQWNHGGAKKRDGRPPKLADYRREEERKKAERRDRREGGYRERDRYEDAARDRERDRDRGRDRDYDRDRGSHRDRDRERDSGRHRSVRKKTGILRC
ncbi:Proteasomal ubiquitin receptor ADRM1-B [Verticillium dahliae VDG2]|nr:Proteasomal ubiquitin receptor ADRM1-B [Verticillium dahliae VDG2]